MADTIVLYATAEHLNSMLLLATFIAKHHPSLHITILSFATEATAASVVSAVPSISYRRLPAVAPPPNSIRNPVEAFFEIPRLSNPNLRAALDEIMQQSRIRALVIDFFCNSAFEVSTSLDIPTYFYVSTGALGVNVLLYFLTVDEEVDSDVGDLNDYLAFPGCPLIHSSDLPQIMFFRQSNIYKHVMCTANNMRKSAGILANGFDAIEFRAKEALINGLCVPDGPTPPVYLVGPLVAQSAAKNEHDCLRWLDRQPEKSVIFLCFGRRGLHSGEQLREIADGLERSGCRFLWSVRNPPEMNSPATDPDLEELLPEGFLERTAERGFVVKSWAPQREVLSHGAVAGFVTHCGRSSVLEAVANGVPMIGWPMYAEQRMNRVFLVEEMKAALPLEEEEGGFVTAAEVEKRVRELMESKTGRDIRHRVAEMKASAAAAVRENGSSVVDLHKFIDAISC